MRETMQWGPVKIYQIFGDNAEFWRYIKPDFKKNQPYFKSYIVGDKMNISLK